MSDTMKVAVSSVTGHQTKKHARRDSLYVTSCKSIYTYKTHSSMRRLSLIRRLRLFFHGNGGAAADNVGVNGSVRQLNIPAPRGEWRRDRDAFVDLIFDFASWFCNKFRMPKVSNLLPHGLAVCPVPPKRRN